MSDINYNTNTINPDPETILRDGLRALGIVSPRGGDSRDEAIIKTMLSYTRFLLEQNQVMNLTAVTNPADIIRLHFLDSCALACFHDFQNQSVIDTGTGAGFPGAPLKMIVPSMRLTLLDAQRKRIDFLRNACNLCDMPDINCVHGRAEELARQPDYREKFDTAVSRAVAALPVLSELCLPFVRTGGCFLAMKSVHADQELSDAARAITTLGGEPEHIYDYAIPGTDITHRLIIIRKVRPAPPRYPRAFAKIKKSPL